CYPSIPFLPKIFSDYEFTNIKCSCFDESFCSFEYCFLKSVNRTYKYGSLKVTLHQGPADKIKANFAIYKRLNGYKPFLYNVTVDACKFIDHPSSSPVMAYIFQLFSPFSNINHSCPFDNVIVDKVSIAHMNKQLTKILPFPKGEYGIFSNWYIYGEMRASVNVYGSLT
ncbi:hypothetical protein KR059_001943, partial [Drosophila kikkawai]